MVDAIGGGGDVKVPGLGGVQKKYVIGGVVVGGLIAVIVYIRIRNTAASTATAAATPDAGAAADPSIDPATGLPYADETSGTIDPATGIPYAEESGGGDYGGGGAYGSTDLDSQGYPIGSAADLAWQAQQTSGITTNEEWVQAAMGDLPGDQATIQAALLGVLSGQTVTTAQKTLFLEAVALNENPPQGYPTPIKTSDTAAQPGTPATTVAVPNIVGQKVDQAGQLLAYAGFKSKFTGNEGDPGNVWVVSSQTPRAGAKAAKGSTVTGVTRKPAAVRK
jgi:PASTA domain